MAGPLAIGTDAPDFEALTTEGSIRFHEWLGSSWGVLLSHPKDFTPVCTTELGYMARIRPEFDRRRVKVIGLSVDPLESHTRWSKDIEETQGHAPNYPMIADADLKVSALYGMLSRHRRRHGEWTHGKRQSDGAHRVRDRAGQENQARDLLSDEHGTQLRRSVTRDRLDAADGAV
jgi:alkyl hydroperoxide reductase subunit AhpC